MSANTFKRLNVSDNFVVPYTANKLWDISSSSFAANKIVINVGIKHTSSLFDPVNEYKTNGQYDRLVYNMINSKYYPGFLPYTVSTQSLQNTIYNDTTLSTSSYYNGHVNLGNKDTIKFFPTGNNATIYVINIPRSLTSDKILPSTFEVYFSSGNNNYSLYDDGNYNLFFSGSPVTSNLGTTLTQGSYIGNIFYEQNIAVLTVVPDVIRLRGWRPIDPICLQASPLPTPSVTPSITISPSITVSPSITPTISRTPFATPSVTPSKTTSPSVTPSKTPSITVSPSITTTPSLTPTVTPSTSNATPSFSVLNSSGVITIENVFSVYTGYPFYTLYPNNNFPVNIDNVAIYGIMGNVNKNIAVVVSGREPTIPINLELYKNNSLQQTIPCNGGDSLGGDLELYKFGNVIFNVGDTCEIKVNALL